MIDRKKSAEELREALKRCVKNPVSPEDVFLQKVSFVYGNQDYDAARQWTKREVAEDIAKWEGYPREWVYLVKESE